MVRVHPAGVDFNVLDVFPIQGTQGIEKAADMLDSGEVEAVLGEEWASVGFVVDATACLKEANAELAACFLFGFLFAAGRRVDDGAGGGEAEAVYDVLYLGRETEQRRLELEVLRGSN